MCSTSVRQLRPALPAHYIGRKAVLRTIDPIFPIPIQPGREPSSMKFSGVFTREVETGADEGSWDAMRNVAVLTKAAGEKEYVE